MKITHCRSCGGNVLLPILSLGTTPLANSLLTDAQLTGDEPRFPLAIVFCPLCSLVQLDYTVPPEDLFSNYVYFSSFSTTMLDHARALTTRMIAERNLTTESRVIEVASNDGYLLQFYRQADIQVLGIEPAENIARIANDAKQIPTLNAFFGQTLADTLAEEGTLADVIHGHNVLAHVPDTNGFVGGLKTILKPEGVIVIEAPYVKDLIDHTEFDTIYHEHFFYFSLTALDNLFSRHGLSIFDVEQVAIHGGSLRIFAGHTEHVERGASVVKMLADERQAGMDTVNYYQTFAGRVEVLKHDLVRVLHDLKSEHKSIAAYGASAKGSTLLNYFGIGNAILDFVADRSTVKQGMYTPGTHLLIRPPSSLPEAMPDYVLLLTWNFAEEILGQQDEYRRNGGKFIVPLPELRIE